MKIGMGLTAVVLAALAPAPAVAGAVVTGFDSAQLARNDDGATGALNLGFTANFFGVTRTTTYVSNNGYVTFNQGQGTYTPGGLGTGYGGQPIIAAFFADVDTRPERSGITSFGSGTIDGYNAFGASWRNVGYYSNGTDKLNTFQLLLADRSDTGSGNFDIYLNYDQIQWETGGASGGSGGVGGTSAAVGYNAGTGNQPGTFFEFTGSRVNGAFLDGGPNSLVAGSNVGIAGRYVFNVRNGAVTPAEPGAVPEPATWGTMILGFGLVGAAVRRRTGALKAA